MNKQPTQHSKPAVLLALLLMALLSLAASTACGRANLIEVPFVSAEADFERGRVAFVEYGCTACHTIPGVLRADATVGPPLSGWAARAYIAGRLPNTPDNLVAWIMSPQSIDPENAMPDVGVPEVAARDMALYLFTLTQQPSP